MEPKVKTICLVIIVIGIVSSYIVWDYFSGEKAIREMEYQKTLDSYSELDECYFVHSPCPFYVLEKKIDALESKIDLLIEGNK